MGYSTYAYAADIDRLRSVFGSNDTTLLQAFDDSKSRLAQGNRGFDDQILEGAPSLRDALAQIIAGTITGPAWGGFMYGYATEWLCAHLGHSLDDENWVDFVERLDVPTGLMGFALPLPIPRPEDFPDIGMLTAEAVRSEYARMKDQDLSHENEAIEGGRKDLLSWLRQAQELGLGLVTFAY